MVLPLWRRTAIWIAAAGFAALLAMMLLPSRGSALPAYAQATGQPCATCHVDPAGGGPLTAAGQAFAAIPTHASDPAGAWARVSAPPAAPPKAPAPAAPAPAAPAAPPAAPPKAPAPAAPAPAAPQALPTTGEASSSDELALILVAFGLVTAGAGLSLKGLGARRR